MFTLASLLFGIDYGDVPTTGDSNQSTASWVTTQSANSTFWNYTLGDAQAHTTRSGCHAFLAATGSHDHHLPCPQLRRIVYQFSTRFVTRKASRCRAVNVEHHLFPALAGAMLLTASLFRIGWTAVPTMSLIVSIVGNGVYIWGSSMTLISFVSYLFDAYPLQGTLSTLTAAACSRLAHAGAIPLVILIAITNIGGGRALSTFRLIAAAFSLFPFVVFFFGKKMRTRRRFYKADHLSPVEEQGRMMAMTNHTDVVVKEWGS
jgi:hypothetical protein